MLILRQMSPINSIYASSLTESQKSHYLQWLTMIKGQGLVTRHKYKRTTLKVHKKPFISKRKPFTVAECKRPIWGQHMFILYDWYLLHDFSEWVEFYSSFSEITPRKEFLQEPDTSYSKQLNCQLCTSSMFSYAGDNSAGNCTPSHICNNTTACHGLHGYVLIWHY